VHYFRFAKFDNVTELRHPDYTVCMSNTKLSPDTIRILRHLVATIAYRASRSLRDAPPAFENARLAGDGMNARELVLHITNVLSFALATVTQTDRVRHDAREWQAEVNRFYALLGELDARLAEGPSVEEGMDLRLVQGPLADALTHIGQLHALRRAAGAPVVPTNYIKADVQAGRIKLSDQGD
jgi:hypothetical protein